MDDRDLKMIIACKTCRTLTEVAQQMNISQPALSKRLHKLEDQLCAKIITLDRFGIQLTDVGERFYNFATKTSALYKEFKTSITKSVNTRMMLKIGVTPVFSRLVLPQIVQSFSQQFPDIYLNICTRFSSLLIELLKTGKLDLAFIRGDSKLEGFERFKIGSDPLVVVSTQQLELEDLSRYPRITYDTDPLLMEQIEQWLSERFGEELMSPAVHVGDSQSCLRTVSQGVGYTIAPLYMLKEWVENELFVKSLETKDGQPFSRDTHLFYNKKLYTESLPLRNMVDLVKNLFPTPSF